MKKVIFTNSAPAPLHNLYSQGVLAQGKLLFTAGQVGIAPGTSNLVEGGIQAQTQQALENVKAIVEAAGASMDNVVKMTVLLADINDFGAMNQVYKTFFGENPPARTAFQAGNLPIGALVEIEAIAVVE